MIKRSKTVLVQELIREFRISGNQDDAFDSLASERLGVNEADLRALNIIENSRGLTAGELATESGLSPGAVTGVIDRLVRAGFVRRISSSGDRRRVRVEVTEAFEQAAERIWGPVAADWHSTLSRRYTLAELALVTDFLRATNEVGRRQLGRLRKTTYDERGTAIAHPGDEAASDPSVPAAPSPPVAERPLSATLHSGRSANRPRGRARSPDRG